MADIYTIKLVDSETIAAAGTYQSDTIPVNAYKPLGNFATQLACSGAGSETTVKMYTSLDGETFIESSTGDLWTSKDPGNYLDSHPVVVCNYFYVIVSVASAEASVDLWMAIQ